MFSHKDIKSSGKHMICDVQEIRNERLLNSLEGIKSILDSICEKHCFVILGKLEYQFEPIGCSLVYLLSESHISIHTFPERNYFALDIYTCRNYENNSVYMKIYDDLVTAFDAHRGTPTIIERMFQ